MYKAYEGQRQKIRLTAAEQADARAKAHYSALLKEQCEKLGIACTPRLLDASQKALAASRLPIQKEPDLFC